MKNERGITAVELLVSLFLLILIISSTFQFHETYKVKVGKIGDSNTARNLAISVLEWQNELTALGDTTEGTILSQRSYVNETEFLVEVVKTKANDLVAYYSNTVPFYKNTVKVSYEGKQIEVSSYVSQK